MKEGRFSEEFINVTSKLMLARERKEIVSIATELNEVIERLMTAEDHGNFKKECKEKSTTAVLKFTQEEISQMAKTFKKAFIANGLVARVTKRESGKNSYCYEIRYRANGYNISASSTDLKKAKQKFLEKTTPKEIEKYCVNLLPLTNNIPNSFKEFTLFYFEKFRKPKVSEQTYYNDHNRLKNHLFPVLGNLKIKNITPAICQSILDKLQEQGKGKTADEIYSLLSVIFKGAIAHGIIERNPLNVVVHIKHKKESGCALTKKEEVELFNAVKNSKYETAYAISLFTGLRPNELFTAEIEGAFIKAINSKRKSRKVEYKKIPICEKLKPYIERFNEVKELKKKNVSVMFSYYCPTHKLYDLRTTFNSRCKELGISEHARMHFMGHSLGALGNAYTDLSDEYLLTEGKKLNNW